MPNPTQDFAPPPITPSLHQWIERCAVRKCEPDHQSALLATFGNMIRKRLARFPEEAACRLRAELFETGSGGGCGTDNLVAFCDRVFYDSYSTTTDELTRALKAHLFSLEPRLALGELSKFRFRTLIDKTLKAELAMGTTPSIPDKGKPSLSKQHYYPDSIHRSDFVWPASDDLWWNQPSNDTLPSVSAFLSDPRFDGQALRIIWIRNHPDLIRSEEALAFTGLTRAQIYNRCNSYTVAIKEWISEHHPDCPRSIQIEFVRDILDTIDERLAAEGAIPLAWRETFAQQP